MKDTGYAVLTLCGTDLIINSNNHTKSQAQKIAKALRSTESFNGVYIIYNGCGMTKMLNKNKDYSSIGESW